MFKIGEKVELLVPLEDMNISNGTNGIVIELEPDIIIAVAGHGKIIVTDEMIRSTEKMTIQKAIQKLDRLYGQKGFERRGEPSPSNLGIPWIVPNWLATYSNNKKQITVWIDPDLEQFNELDWDKFPCWDLPSEGMLK